jgi:hypothetical protein
MITSAERRRSLFSLILLLLASSWMPTLAAPPTSPPDARLEQKLSLALKATALSDLCARLRQQTGVALTAGQSVADEKVTVFCRERPLREVMRQLSQPFGYSWLRSGAPPGLPNA